MAKSFLRDELVYPFPVHYRHFRDSAGRAWEIAFMDESPASHEGGAWPVVFLVHGRGVNASYFKSLISALLERGFRVVAPDIPHYGKSNPGNLDLPLTRSLQEVRFLFHQLLTELGIDKVAFVGHSLGGQIALGYALDYPEQVSHLVMMASPGLIEFAQGPLYRPELADDFAAWLVAWNAKEVIEREMARTAEEIRAVHYGQNGLWFFSQHGPLQEEITSQRIGLASAPLPELRNHATIVQREMFNLGTENRRDDPRSLTKRIGELKMPVFIAFGEIDPFIPPSFAEAQNRLNKAGNSPYIKVYPQTGHFIHIEAFEQLVIDLPRFLATG